MAGEGDAAWKQSQNAAVADGFLLACGDEVGQFLWTGMMRRIAMRMRLLCFVILALPAALAQAPVPVRSVAVPGESSAQIMRWLESRKARQVQAIKEEPVFHGFSLHDATAASQITFRHGVVAEAAQQFKPNHYDHGTAVAAADVDADGRTDLLFVNQRGGNELWRNRGGGRFENITERAGIALANAICAGASFGDIDNDGLPDLFITTVKMGNHLFRNEGGGSFRDISESAGLRDIGHSSGAVFFDYDRDGRLDLFVCNVGVYTSALKAPDGSFHALDDAFIGFLDPKRHETSVLYHNEGGLKFRNANRELGVAHREWSGDATFCDLDRSGYPGLYAVSMSGRNAYYHNEGGMAFRDQTKARFRRAPWGAMGVKFFDFDQDGREDLYVTDMHSDMNTAQLELGATDRSERFEGLKSEAWCSAEWVKNNWPGSSTNFLFGNAFYKNDGTQFAEISEKIGAETYWPWGISAGDLNADGFEDVFVTAGMGYPQRYSINSLLLNDAGRRFVAAEFALGVEPRPKGQVLIEAFTLDCDGADKGHAFCQGKPGKVTVRAAASSRSSLFCDLDDDGDLDLVVNEMIARPTIFTSDLSTKRSLHYLKIKLRGTKSNRDGLGAFVTVTTPDRTLHQFHDGKSGYLAQSSLPLYFGLDRSERVSQIEVLWPSGTKQQIADGGAINRSLEIVEPE